MGGNLVCFHKLLISLHYDLCRNVLAIGQGRFCFFLPLPLHPTFFSTDVMIRYLLDAAPVVMPKNLFGFSLSLQGENPNKF